MRSLIAMLIIYAATPATASDEASTSRFVRSVSIDLRGTTPTDDEVAAVDADGALSDDILDQWLDSDAFVSQVIEQHRAIVWNELSTNAILRRRRLRTQNGVWYNDIASQVTRGNRFTPCSNTPALPVAAGEGPLCLDGTRNLPCDEGYVEVAPFWEPDTLIRVCAFDAQETLISSTRTDCAAGRPEDDPECGCGPNMQWCVTRPVELEILDSLAEEVEHHIRYALETDSPYDEVLTGQHGFANGPLSHFYRHLVAFDSTRLGETPDAPDLARLAYTDTTTWVRYARADEHSGILTSPGWLMRHQTNRGRANRFYEGFLCKEFTPLAGGIGGLEQGTPTPDLTLRAGCRDCHGRLEGMAAYWGRWSAAGMAYKNESSFPAFSQDCRACALYNVGCTSTCRRDYVWAETHPDERPFLGYFQPYAFLTSEAADNPTMGPAEWVDEAVVSGELAQCTTKSVASWLLGAEAENTPEDLAAWTAAFEKSGMNYKELVRAIIGSEAYRRQQ